MYVTRAPRTHHRGVLASLAVTCVVLGCLSVHVDTWTSEAIEQRVDCEYARWRRVCVTCCGVCDHPGALYSPRVCIITPHGHHSAALVSLKPRADCLFWHIHLWLLPPCVLFFSLCFVGL